jgi:glutathionylspermidine synthase
MKRIQLTPRADWQAKVEQVGLTFHTLEGELYWDESAAYELSAREIDELENAANTLHELCLKAAQHIIDEDLFDLLAIPREAVPHIVNSWNRDDFSLYGRLDVAYAPGQRFKLLEYNADTPTALVEAAVAQWYWMEEASGLPRRKDQFNSIHEKLIEAWKELRLSRAHIGGVRAHLEDEQTVLYIADTAHQAGLKVKQLSIEDLGWDADRSCFVDLDNEPITTYFKLFPWEWMWDSDYAEQLKLERCRFIEPMWKMLLSNKAILPILWKLFPNHPNLLPAAFSVDELPTACRGNYVQKPKLSREGANVTVFRNGRMVTETTGEYGKEGFVYQALADIPEFSGNHPVLGLWIVNHTACGLGIREDRGLVTGNHSRFVPHYFI